MLLLGIINYVNNISHMICISIFIEYNGIRVGGCIEDFYKTASPTRIVVQNTLWKQKSSFVFAYYKRQFHDLFVSEGQENNFP